MEFWGVEVKAGEPFKVEPGAEKLLHLSQASLGEVKKDKGNESIPLFAKIGDQKLVLGTLSREKFPQISFDLVFEKDFELSHNWKNGSVYFCGYKSANMDGSDYSTDSDSEFGEDLLLNAAENGKSEPKVELLEQAKASTGKASTSKPDSSAAKPKVKIVEPNKDVKSKDDDDEDDEDEDSEEDESDDDEDMVGVGDESDEEDDDESSDEEDEETPKKSEPLKKRPADSATKTPAPEKKAKFVTPQKTDAKKGSVHIATPYPSKQAGRTPAKIVDKPKPVGQVSCKSCSKTFNSENALQSHSKAKHSGGQ